MERRISRSLPWRRRPFPELVRLAWPIAISTVSYSVMTLVGTLFVGRLGAAALAGVGLGGVACFTLLCFGFGALRGVNVLVSQAHGAGDPERAGTWLWTGLALALGLGVVMLGAGQLLASQIHRLASSAAAGAPAADYVAVRMLGAPLVMIFVAVREHRYGQGDTRSAMVAAVAGNVANMLLDWLLIVELEVGVIGAAWATVGGLIIEVLVVAWVQARDDWRPRPVRLEDLRALLAVGLPTGLQFWMEVGSFALLTAIVASLGDQELAAHQIALQVAHFSFLPAMSLGEAGSVLAGQAVGAGEVRLVRRVARIGLVGALAYTGICTVVLVAGAGPIASAFTSDPSLVATTRSLLWMAALFQMADGAAVVARGVLRGTGDVRYPAMIGIGCAWVCTPPLTWLLGRMMGLGALGGWVGLSLEITAVAALYWWRLARGGWLASARESRARLRASERAAQPALAAAV